MPVNWYPTGGTPRRRTPGRDSRYGGSVSGIPALPLRYSTGSHYRSSTGTPGPAAPPATPVPPAAPQGDSRSSTGNAIGDDLRGEALRELRLAVRTPGTHEGRVHLDAARLFYELSLVEGSAVSPRKVEPVDDSEAQRESAGRRLPLNRAERVREFCRAMAAAGVPLAKVSATEAARVAGCSRQNAAKVLARLRAAEKGRRS